MVATGTGQKLPNHITYATLYKIHDTLDWTGLVGLERNSIPSLSWAFITCTIGEIDGMTSFGWFGCLIPFN